MGVENQEAASPDASDTLDGQQHEVDQSAPAVDDAGAESSPAAADDGEKKDLLSVVRDATREKPEAEEPESPTGEGDESAEGGSSDEDEQSDTDGAAERDDEDFSDVPFHKHPRFKELIAQRDQYKQGAEEFSKIQSYLQSQGISPEEAAGALELQALLKGDPEKAWERLRPIAQDLLQKTGQILPPDLKERVRKGNLSQADAMQLSRARVSSQLNESRREHEQAQRQRQEAGDRQRKLQSAAANWETAQRNRLGADFDGMSEDVAKEVTWLQRRDGVPRDPAGVTRMLDQALKNVSAKARKVERKPSKTPVRGGQVASGATRSRPETVLDIVKQGGATG